MAHVSDLLPALRPTTLADQAVFERYYREYPQTICEYTFAQMLLWGEDRQHRWTEIDDHLIVSFQKRGETLCWYEPIGSDPAGLIREKMHPKDGFSYLYVSEKTAKALESDCTVQETPERFDYIYSVDALRNLEGKDYSEKRNFINRARKYNTEIIALGPDVQEEAEAMLKRWMTLQPREGMNSLIDEIRSLRLAMENWEVLKLFGIGIRIAGQLEAFSFGVELNPTMFVEYFQKSTNSVPGLYPLVLHELMRALPEKYSEINLEEDLGIPGLRTAKQRWNPAYLVKKYELLA